MNIARFQYIIYPINILKRFDTAWKLNSELTVFSIGFFQVEVLDRLDIVRGKRFLGFHQPCH